MRRQSGIVWRPRGVGIESGIVGQARQSLFRKVPDPDIALLIAEIQGDLGAIWRQSRELIRSSRRVDRLFVSVPADPHERPLRAVSFARNTWRIDQGAVSGHGEVGGARCLRDNLINDGDRVAQYFQTIRIECTA